MKKAILMAVLAIFAVKLSADTTATVSTVQYWIDNGQASAATAPSYEFEVDCSGLSDGFHILHYRVADSRGRYSKLHEHGFMKLAAAVKADSVSTFQYWWDNDIDDAVSAPYTSEMFSLSTASLAHGLHSLSYRVKDNAGRWSELHSHYFYKGEVSDSARIVGYTYWWNDLTGKTVTRNLETPSAAIVIEDDLTMPEYARTSYAGHYTATLNLIVTDNHGRSSFHSADVTYPDNDKPSTEIDADDYSPSGEVMLRWKELTGDDVASYNVYFSDNDGLFLLWLADTSATEATFRGVAGHRYKFTVTAIDRWGNREDYDEDKCISVKFK